jgi:hypothetical protein
MDVPQVANVMFTLRGTGPGRDPQLQTRTVRVALYPRSEGARPPKFSDQQRDEIKRIALSRPEDHGQRFSTWCRRRLNTGPPTPVEN